jgi:hypothetical protein
VSDATFPQCLAMLRNERTVPVSVIDQVEAAEDAATAEFLAEEYRCGCGMPPGSPYCMCAADPGALRRAMAVIAAVHHDAGGDCPGCARPAVLCGYTKLVQCVKAPPPAAVSVPSGGV